MLRLDLRQTRYGWIGALINNSKLFHLVLAPSREEARAQLNPDGQAALTQEISPPLQALQAFFDGHAALTPASAGLELAPQGTVFQQEVWQALQDIPSGGVRSYQEIAAVVGRPGAARAVGSACAKNPIPFFIPCHRVLASNSGMGGYAYGTELKKTLLEQEKWDSGSARPVKAA